MRPCHSSIPILACFLYLGLYQTPANPAIRNLPQQILILPQISTTEAVLATILRPDSTGSDVETLQTQLKELGYYKDVVDGKYKETTKTAVAEFQKAQGLEADGIFGNTTKKSIQSAIAAKKSFTASPVPTSKPSEQNSPKHNVIRWSLLGLGILGSIGAIVYFVRKFTPSKQLLHLETSDTQTRTETNNSTIPLLPESKASPEEQQDDAAIADSPDAASMTPKLLPPANTSRLAKVNIVDELINDLYNPDPAKRHKAIWDLGQQGDSRAIQPLLDLMLDADSQQHSLILAALSEIGIRTLKPMNRALAISIQNESPQVRQNAIRDLTRVYDMMSQVSQMLRHAVEDPDLEVQSTARYALNQINRIRVVCDRETLPEHEENDN
ncbi:peptidoglycan-binding protein [Calothrix anomala]|uniref:Peptidoglycan-binding protein n=2 Tax=Calothrix TaxID=1186 RepID=A0ABR8ABD5_9CYAN|nr:peptidoglycan-binding protein [Calothrix parietina FACHB-288]MBD2225258.1 peptidoglycan-binding protein [Calothrix anomala FACHB-343]